MCLHIWLVLFLSRASSSIHYCPPPSPELLLSLLYSMSQEEPGLLKLASSCRVDAALFWVVSACHAESTANCAKAFSSMATHSTELSEAIGEGSKREKTGNRHSKKPPSTHILCGQNNYNNNKTELSDCRWEYRTATASCELVGFHLSGWGRENGLKRKWLVVSMGG